MNKKLLFCVLISSILHISLLVGFNSTILEPNTLNFSNKRGTSQIKAKLSLYQREQKPKPKKKVSKKSSNKAAEEKKTKKSMQNKSAIGESNSGQETLIAKYLTHVRKEIAANKKKKRIAKRLRLTGKVKLNFYIIRPNKIERVKITESNAHKQIELSALETINSVSNIPAIPKEINLDEIAVTLEISYE